MLAARFITAGAATEAPLNTQPPAARSAPANNHGRPIRVLVVDDHAVIRQGLRMLLESRPEIEVAGDCENGREALLAVERTRPDVVLMDVVMPGLNGIEATRQIRKASPSTRVVILTGFVDDEQITASMRSGASGYLVKNSDVSELILAIQTVTGVTSTTQRRYRKVSISQNCSSRRGGRSRRAAWTR